MWISWYIMCGKLIYILGVGNLKVLLSHVWVDLHNSFLLAVNTLMSKCIYNSKIVLPTLQALCAQTSLWGRDFIIIY